MAKTHLLGNETLGTAVCGRGDRRFGETVEIVDTIGEATCIRCLTLSTQWWVKKEILEAARNRLEELGYYEVTHRIRKQYRTRWQNINA